MTIKVNFPKGEGNRKITRNPRRANLKSPRAKADGGGRVNSSKLTRMSR